MKVRDDGTVKVLDFGLAKAVLPGADAPGLHSDVANSPTMLSPARTEVGMILGTAAYMSPEQAKGRAVDKRADIWAFGVVLYEMLTGRSLFDGDSVAETIGLVATSDPDWTALPASTPASVRRLARALPDARSETSIARHRRGAHRPRGARRSAGRTSDRSARRRAARADDVDRPRPGCGCCRDDAAWLLKPPPVVTNVVSRFNSLLPAGQAFTGGTGRRVIAISPDGTKVAYIANGQLYLRGMNQLEAQPIRGSDEDPYELMFSPDGQWIAYFAHPAGPDRILKKISVAGGTPVTLCPTPLHPDRLSWHGSTISFAQYQRDTLNAIQTVADSAVAPLSRF